MVKMLPLPLVWVFLWTSTVCLVEVSSEPAVFCYYSSFAQNRQGVAKFVPEDIDPFLCTHVIFAFADVIQGKYLKPSSWNDVPNGKDRGLYERTIALKEKNPRLRVLLAIGGWRIGSEPFLPVVQNDSTRKTFVRNVVRYLRKHGFDGLDMDWEFPGTRGSAPEDKYKFTELMQELQDAFQRESRQTGREKLLLTMAAAGGSYFIGLAYEPQKIVKIVDYLLLMAYNYHGSWNEYTGHHSGLYPRSDEVGGEREWNQDWTIDYWVKEAGADPDKVIVGIATYGMSFTLADPAEHGLKAAATGGGKGGRYTKEMGILAYFEICENLEEGWNTVWLEEQRVPYAYSGDQWVGYDNTDSVTYKARNIRERGLGGAFIWSVEMDDFSGHCGTGRYPLLKTIVDVLKTPVSRQQPDTFRDTYASSTDREYEFGNYDAYEDSVEDRYGPSPREYERTSSYNRHEDSQQNKGNSPSDLYSPTSSNMQMYYEEDENLYSRSYESSQPGNTYKDTSRYSSPPGQSYRERATYGDTKDMLAEKPVQLPQRPVEFYRKRFSPEDVLPKRTSGEYQDTDRSDMYKSPQDPSRTSYTEERYNPDTFKSSAILRSNYDDQYKRNQPSSSRYDTYPSSVSTYRQDTLEAATAPRTPIVYARNEATLSSPSTSGSGLIIPPARPDVVSQLPSSYPRMLLRRNSRQGYPSEIESNNLGQSRRQLTYSGQYPNPIDDTENLGTYSPYQEDANTELDYKHQDGKYTQKAYSRDRADFETIYERKPTKDDFKSVEDRKSNSNELIVPEDTLNNKLFNQVYGRGVQNSLFDNPNSGSPRKNNEYANAYYPQDPQTGPYVPSKPSSGDDVKSDDTNNVSPGGLMQPNGLLNPFIPFDQSTHLNYPSTFDPMRSFDSMKSFDPRPLTAQSWQYNDAGTKCREAGMYAHPTSCRSYFICVRHGSRWYKFHLTCPPGLAYDPHSAACADLPSCTQ